MNVRDALLWGLRAQLERLWCRIVGHRWSRWGDENAAGWFHDTGGGADCYTRSCARCFYAEHRERDAPPPDPPPLRWGRGQVPGDFVGPAGAAREASQSSSNRPSGFDSRRSD